MPPSDVSPRISQQIVKDLARECGFELAGVASALPPDDYRHFEEWRKAGFAAEMSYLTDHRGDLRSDPRHLLPSVQTVVCVGRLYNTEKPYSVNANHGGSGWVARYAWGDDYHDVLRSGLQRLVERIASMLDDPFDSRICVDTAPLLERSFARLAGLGWIGKNTCLINQQHGSWFVLGELLLSLSLVPDTPPPDRCGTCRRCIDACPTNALVPDEQGRFQLDSRQCISYLTIEKQGDLPDQLEPQMGAHIFGCDICQDVCPWNRKSPATEDLSFAPHHFSPSLAELANLSEADFRHMFRTSPIWRSKYPGFLRNVAIAMGNSGQANLLEPLRRLSLHSDALVSKTAGRAYRELSHHLLSDPVCSEESSTPPND